MQRVSPDQRRFPANCLRGMSSTTLDLYRSLVLMAQLGLLLGQRRLILRIAG